MHVNTLAALITTLLVVVLVATPADAQWSWSCGEMDCPAGTHNKPWYVACEASCTAKDCCMGGPQKVALGAECSVNADCGVGLKCEYQARAVRNMCQFDNDAVMCGDFVCPVGQVATPQPPNGCTGGVCTAAQCCLLKEQTCLAQRLCPAGMHRRSAAAQTFCFDRPCAVADCCLTNNKCAQTGLYKYTCPDKLRLVPSPAKVTCAAPNCVDSDCCAPDNGHDGPKQTCQFCYDGGRLCDNLLNQCVKECVRNTNTQESYCMCHHCLAPVDGEVCAAKQQPRPECPDRAVAERKAASVIR